MPSRRRTFGSDELAFISSTLAEDTPSSSALTIANNDHLTMFGIGSHGKIELLLNTVQGQ